jgi:8-oxo-dGTP pyrophosphatase MutT (NUDIX family)
VPDGRYLLQLRDDKPSLPLRDHWVLFGGQVESGESGEGALRREMDEELGHRVGACHWYHEAAYVLPRAERRVVLRRYFTMPVMPEEIAAMTLHEGAAMKLFSVEEILSLPRVSPWDLAVILMHARASRLFAL